MVGWVKQEPIDPDDVTGDAQIVRVVTMIIDEHGHRHTMGFAASPDEVRENNELFLTRYFESFVDGAVEAGIVDDLDWWIDFSPKK